MRTSTILGISISLAAGMLLGTVVTTLTSDPTPATLPEKQLADAKLHTPAKTRLSMGSSYSNDPELQQAERLLTASRPTEALSILSSVSPTIDLSTTKGKEWLRLLVDAYTATNNANQLLLIYNRYPSALGNNEQAALTVARTLIANKQTADYRPIRKMWTGKESEKARWFFLDVQEKINDGKPQEAISLLLSNHFTGRDETDRLVRLAALHVANEPKRAWEYLSEASQKDPSNADIRTFKASVSEILHENQTATTDYMQAVQNDPESPYRREQLADYYLRTGQYSHALKILKDTMLDPSLDTIWVKTLFWNRMVAPVQETWKGAEIPEGTLKPFVAYLASLPEGLFWNEAAFAALPESSHYLNTRQETFWLQLLNALKTVQEETAMQLMENNPFHHVSWAPEMEKAIKTLLTFRKSQREGTTASTLSLYPRVNEIDSPRQLLDLLASLSDTKPEQIASAIPADLHQLLASQEAFVLPFLGAGWNEAAIQLHSMKQLPDAFPFWVAASLTEALSQNRSLAVALDFASAQKPSPSLSLLIAELALANNQKQIAFNALKEIYTAEDVSGQRAALILGQFLMDHNNIQDAKKALMAQPALAEDAAARELLARIAVQEGEMERAAELYQTLEKHSAEAKSFLARKAYADKDWTRARQLTEALLKEYPGNSTLADNLKKITYEEKKARTQK